MAAHGRRARQETALRHAGLQANRSKVQNAVHTEDHIAQPAEGSREGRQDRFVETARSASQATGFRGFRRVRVTNS